MIPKLLQDLRRRFSRSPNLLQNRGGVVLLPFHSLRPHWILGRGLCLYRCESFEHVPRAKREAALALQASSWSPFERTGHFAVWSGGNAMVWYWDADAVDMESGDSMLAEAGVDPSQCLVLPETLFRPQREDGIHLQQCHEGFEIQCWRSGLLKDAFWSSQPPTEQRLAWFADRQGLAEAAVPPVLDELLAEPWSADTTPREWLLRNELRLAAAVAMVLTTVLVWQEARQWKYGLGEDAFNESFSLIQDEVAPFMAARDGHRRLNRINERLNELLLAPSQAYLMGVVDRTTPNPEAKFTQWRYQEGELQVVVEDAAASPVEYVRLLEEQPIFADVRVEQARGENRLELSMRIVR